MLHARSISAEEQLGVEEKRMSPEADQDQVESQRSQDNPLSEWYETEVWGKRASDDNALYEVMSLQVFQAGLSWNMVLARRDAFRRAFEGWNIDAVAAMGPKKVESILLDPSIIRNRRKIEACIENARIIQGLQREHGSFCGWYYDGLEEDDLASLQKTLRAAFRFMGPEIARMWLLASGRISYETPQEQE